VVLKLRPARRQWSFLGFPAVPNAKGTVDFVITDLHVFSTEEAVQIDEGLAVLTRCQCNSIVTRYHGDPSEMSPDSRALAKGQERLPTEEGKFIFEIFSDLSKLNYTFLKVLLEILNRNPNSLAWCLANPGLACENIKCWLKMQGKDDNGNHWITRFVFTETVLKDSHILRSALGSVCLFTYPYSAHTVASDSTGALVPGISVSIPSEEVIWSRWAYNVPGSLALALFGPGSPWLTWSIHEQFQVADFFAKNPRDLALWVERMRTLKEQQYGVFDEGHFVKEFEKALRMVADEFVDGCRSRVIDARIAQDAPPLSGALPNPPRIDCESSKNWELWSDGRWPCPIIHRQIRKRCFPSTLPD
jgi:hypothetical protein